MDYFAGLDVSHEMTSIGIVNAEGTVIKEAKVASERDDARGIANIRRTGWFRAVHVKTHTAQELRFLLVARQTLVRKLMDIDLAIRGMLRSFGVLNGRSVQAMPRKVPLSVL